MSLKKLWPNVALRPHQLAAATGFDADWQPTNTGYSGDTKDDDSPTAYRIPNVACPECGNTPLWVDVSRDPAGGWWAECDACEYGVDLFGLYQHASGLSDPTAALDALRARGAFVRKGTRSPAVLKQYQRHAEARKAFGRLAATAGARRVGRIEDTAFTTAGLQEHPHNPPLWWASTAAELKLYLEDCGDPRGSLYAAFKAGADFDVESATALAVPAYDRLDRVVGVWMACGDVNDVGFQAYRGVPGAGPGVAFLGAAGGRGAWGPQVVVVPDVRHALLIHAAHVALNGFGQGRPPVVGVEVGEGAGWAAAVAKVLDGRDCVVWTPHWGDIRTYPKVLALAKALGARVGTRGNVMRIRLNYPTALCEYVAAAVPWAEALGDAVERATDSWVPPLLAEVGWNRMVAETVRPVWKASVYDKAVGLTAVRAACREVRAGRDLTVAVTNEGWVHAESGEALLDAVPVVTAVYRDDAGKVRHAGYVRFGGNVYKFDSAGFRKDAAAVIEAALLRGGCDRGPLVHPLIADKLAALALYFSKFKKVGE